MPNKYYKLYRQFVYIWYVYMDSYRDVLLIVANVINVVYNIPQIIRTYKTKSANDFDTWFIVLRIVYNILWIMYGIDDDNMLIVLNSVVTIFTSGIIGYYKFWYVRDVAIAVVPIDSAEHEWFWVKV